MIANNGQAIYESDAYSSIASCTGAIKTFKKNALNAEYDIEKDEEGKYRYVLKKGNGGAYYGKSFINEPAALSNIESVISFAQTDIIVIAK